MPVNVKGGALEFDAFINSATLEAQLNKIENQLRGLTNTATKEANAIDRLTRNTVSAIAAYATFSVGSNIVQDIVRVRGEFQQLEVAFSTMLGSKEKADKLLAQATDLAAKTPFTLLEVGQASKQLLAYGFAADDLVENIKMLGDVSSGVGAPLGDIVYLYGTLRTQGRAFQKDITQFTGRGINIVAELAKQFGVAQSEVTKMVEAGKVGFPEIEKAFKSLTGQGGMFFNLMEAQSKTLTGQLSNLQDAFNNMLNELGKGGEGAFESIIASAQFLIKNYKEVLKIMEVLIITYGSYRAAIIATNLVTSISTSLTKGWTLAEILRFKAMQISAAVSKILNATLLKTPAAFVVAGLAALVSSLTLFSKKTTEAQRTQKMLNEVQQEASKVVLEEKNNLQNLLKVAQDETKSKQDRETAIRRINAISPEYLGNLTLENLKTAEGKRLIDLYVKALERKALAQAVNNKIIKLQEDRLDMLDAKANASGLLKEATIKAADAAVDEIDRKISTLSDKNKAALEEDLKAEGSKQVAKKRTIDVIDEEIKNLKAEQQAKSTNFKENEGYQKKINALENEKRKITGETNKTTAAANALENKANSLLEKRKGLLEEIADQKRNADQSGLIKEQSELDKINERYDAVLQNITDYNKKVDEFNKKNPKNKVSKIGQVDIVELNNSRSKELDNTTLKNQADKYKAYLQRQKVVFDEYEQAKKEVGVQKANEMYADQTKGYTTFLESLQNEANRFAPKIQSGIANIGEVEKFKAVTDAISEYNKQKDLEDLQQEKENFSALLEASTTYSEQRLLINKKYDDLEATLSKNKSLKEYDERKKILEQGRKDELSGLDSYMARASSLYRQLNQDILLFTRERIKEEIKLLKDKLKTDTTLSPQQKADIQATIDQYKGLLEESNKTAKGFFEAAKYLSAASGAFGDLAAATEDLNAGLSDTLQTLSDITGVGASAAAAIAQFASGNIVGAIASTVQTIVGLFSLGKKARESRREAEKEVQEFNTKVLAGEMQITQEYRNRQREQVALNKLKLKGLSDEKKLLEEQKKLVEDQYNSLLKQLQQESFISGKGKEKYGGFLGIARKTRATDISETIGNRTFTELEKLFTQGRLDGKAKELFEMLQKIKQEGADIDAMLLENEQKAKEIFTGTTTDSLVDSIASGFENGLKSAGDFADTFQDLMRNALIQSLKFKYLEAPLKDFFEQFAAASQSDSQLTNSEIDNLNQVFNDIINNANTQFAQLQQIAGLNFGSSGSKGNSLTGAIKGITEQQADLLAGQFGGLRITALETLGVSKGQLTALNLIEVNTRNNNIKMGTLLDKIYWYYEVKGVKVI